MTVYEKNYSRSLSADTDNPYVVGGAFLAAGVIIGIVTLFAISVSTGILQLSERSVLAIVSIFSGVLTLGIVLCFTVPVFIKASNSEKVTGKIVGENESPQFQPGQTGENYTSYSTVVEYDFEGVHYKRKLPSQSSVRPEIGSDIELIIYRKNPEKLITKGDVVLSVIFTIVFSIAAFLFALPGINALRGISGFEVTNTAVSGNPDAKDFAFIFGLIGGGLALLFLLIGIGFLASENKKKGKLDLRTEGIKKTCMVLDVYVNENTYINGRNPVKITLSDEGKTFIAKTKAEPGCVKQKAGDKIDVYFDPNNEKNFYADLGE